VSAHRYVRSGSGRQDLENYIGNLNLIHVKTKSIEAYEIWTPQNSYSLIGTDPKDILLVKTLEIKEKMLVNSLAEQGSK